MSLPSEAVQLMLYLNASDRIAGKAVYRVVVETARQMHLAGASVFLVDFSYGTHRRLHDARSDYLSFDIPVVVEIVEAAGRITELLGSLDTVIAEGLVVTRPVRVVRYAGSVDPGQDPVMQPSSNAGPATHDPGSIKAMKIEGEAQRVTVYLGNSDTWHGRNLVTAIVEKCRELGIAGATASMGVMGFGKNSRIHRAGLLGLSADLPEKVEIIDTAEQITRLLPVLEAMLGAGLIIVEDVHVVRYRHEAKP
jgi:PII-like signaling protein